MIKAIIKEKEYFIEFGNSGKEGNLNGEDFKWDILSTGDRKANIIYKGQSFNLVLENQEGNEITLRVNGKKVLINTQDKLSLLLESMGLNVVSEQKINHVKAPMPGLVLRVLIEPGDTVKKGDGLFVLEAMKMENMIKSPTDAIVSKIKVNLGQAVEKNHILVEFE